MMARMTPVSLHFSDVPTGWKKKYRQTTVGYWFCMFVTNSLSRRTVLQINLRQLHSVPCATRYTQAFQLPQAASKQRSVPWCCRCGMFAAFSTAAIRLLRSIFIWAPPRTRPKFQHLCERRKIFQPVSRMLILEIHNAVVAVPADVTSLGCHCPPNMFYASDCFFDIFHMMMTKVWYCHGHDLCPASRDLLRCPAIVWLVWIAGFLVGTAANTAGGVCLLPMTHFLLKTTGRPAFTR